MDWKLVYFRLFRYVKIDERALCSSELGRRDHRLLWVCAKAEAAQGLDHRGLQESFLHRECNILWSVGWCRMSWTVHCARFVRRKNREQTLKRCLESAQKKEVLSIIKNPKQRYQQKRTIQYGLPLIIACCDGRYFSHLRHFFILWQKLHRHRDAIKNVQEVLYIVTKTPLTQRWWYHQKRTIRVAIDHRVAGECETHATMGALEALLVIRNAIDWNGFGRVRCLIALRAFCAAGVHFENAEQSVIRATIYIIIITKHCGIVFIRLLALYYLTINLKKLLRYDMSSIETVLVGKAVLSHFVRNVLPTQNVRRDWHNLKIITKLSIATYYCIAWCVRTNTNVLQHNLATWFSTDRNMLDQVVGGEGGLL